MATKKRMTLIESYGKVYVSGYICLLNGLSVIEKKGRENDTRQ